MKPYFDIFTCILILYYTFCLGFVKKNVEIRDKHFYGFRNATNLIISDRIILFPGNILSATSMRDDPLFIFWGTVNAAISVLQSRYRNFNERNKESNS